MAKDVDGSIRIGCELETDDFDKELNNLKRMLEMEEKEPVTKKVEIAFDESTKPQEKVEALDKAIQELTDSIAEAKKEGQEMTMAWMQGGMPLDSTFENLVARAEQLEQDEAQLADLTKQRAAAVKEVEKAEKEAADAAKKSKQQAEKIGNSLQNAVKRAGQLVLGIFAIRSAISSLQRASSDLAGYDEEYAANLQYIRYVLTEAIAPVLRGIVQLAATLLNYILQILHAWFGWPLGKTAEEFQNMKKSSGGIAENMKEAEKSAQGFDELNVLQDTSKTGKTSAGGATPSIDLSGMQGQTPEWLQWIIDNGDKIIAILGGIAAAIVALKLGLGGLKALGIGLAVTGIIMIIQNLIEYLQDPTWENFGGIIEGIGLLVAGIGVAFGGLPAIIAGVITFIVGFIAKHWEEIKAWWNGVIDWFKKTGEWIHENCGDFLGGIWDTITDFVEGVGKILGAVFETIKGVFDGIIQFFTGVFTGDWSKAWEGIKKIFQSVWDGICKIGETIFNFFKNLITRVWDAISGIVKGALNALFSLVEEILNLPIRAINGLIWVINLVPGVEIPEIPLIKLPRLRTGGIVNMPNKGTMVGGAIAGESGREGVIPLTDSQAMETLGENIGKYVTINATINNTMDGKLISRHIQKIQSQQAFAGNF